MASFLSAERTTSVHGLTAAQPDSEVLRIDPRDETDQLPAFPGPLRVLLIMGHPRADSLVAALARAYEQAARATGAAVRVLDLHRLAFDPHVRSADFAAQPCEPDIQHARDDLRWAQHVVIAYPLWWGAMPALLKGFLDRLLAPGFAFAERAGGWGFRGLLHGRSAHLLVTMDTPPLIYRWLLRRPGVTALRRDVLGFCGITPCGVTLFGPVLHASPARRQRWLDRAAALGSALPRTVPRATAAGFTIRSWLAALRLQFYPMSWLAYTIGAWCAAGPAGIAAAAYWLGYIALFLLEAATVLSNDLIDAPSDRRNRHDGPFNGGSRVLVDKRLPAAHLRVAAAASAVLGIGMFATAAWAAGLSWALAVPLILITTALCLGYTVPPLRLSYRGLGELDVGITHGLLVLLIGWLLQGGAWNDPLPWLLALPLSLAIVPSIIVANLPDRIADAAVGKGTLAVRLGGHRAALAAAGAALLAVGTGILLATLPASAGLLDGIALPTALHAGLVTWLLLRHMRRGAPDGRSDGLILATLTFMIWYLAIPVWHLAHR